MDQESPGSFSLEFDPYDLHCYCALEDCIDAAPEDLRPAMAGTLDLDEIRRMLNDALELEEDPESARAQACEGAIGAIEGHPYACLCAGDAADSAISCADDLLAEIGSATWHIDPDGNFYDDFQTCTWNLSSLFDLLGWRDGWDSFKLTFAEGKLVADFADAHVGARGRATGFALNANQARFVTFVEDDESVAEHALPRGAAAFVRTLDEHFVALAVEMRSAGYTERGTPCRCWDSCPRCDLDELSIDDIVFGLNERGAGSMPSSELEVMAGLAKSWSGSLEDLFMVARQSVPALI
jgi:hypothetical protein